MAGEPAFTGSNNSSVRGSWGQTQVDLSSYAGPGDTVELRLELGYDGCGGLHGWYVDDVRLYSCSAAVDVALAKQVTPATALPGQAVTFQLTLTNPSPLPAANMVLTETLPPSLTVTQLQPRRHPPRRPGRALDAGQPSPPAVSTSTPSPPPSTR